MSDSSNEDWIDDPGGGSSSSEDGTVPPERAGDAPPIPEGGPLLEELTDVAAHVKKLEAVACCTKHCFTGKRDAAISFFMSLSRMTRSERQVSLLTTLGCRQPSPAKTTARDASHLSLFGMFCANDSSYNHFMYSERKGGKGADEVTSMLHHTLDLYGVLSTATADVVEKTESPGRVTVWADNCGGQNKNSQVAIQNPFVPARFRDDPIYQKPSEQMTETALEIKRARRKKAHKKRKQREAEAEAADDDEGKQAIV
ncbi:hypothetical protein ON010_g14088 [Phytophthora cinnamomi]|nr:hypothetical protein ON010_g14088 [Phytophthora cinnamomi]